MGLLKSLFGSVAEKALSQVKDAIANATQQQNQTSGHTPAQAPAYTPSNSGYEREKSPEEWQAFFRNILQTEFAAYGIREDVPVTELAGAAADSFQLYRTRPTQVYKAEWGKPYSFVMYQGIQPKAVVMLGGGHSHFSNVKYLISRMYAKKLGLPYINFYTQMPNERAYVAGRIAKFLR